MEFHVSVRWTPHPVIVTIGDNRDYIRVLLYSYYTTITGWGVLSMYLALWDYFNRTDREQVQAMFSLAGFFLPCAGIPPTPQKNSLVPCRIAR